MSWLVAILIVGLLATTAFVSAYSYLAWRDDPDRQAAGLRR